MTIKLQNEKLPGRPKKAKSPKQKKAMDLSAFGPTAEDIRRGEEVAKVKKRASEEARKLFADGLSKVKIPGKGPAELQSMAELEREYNGNAFKKFNQLPLMFPLPHFRNDPTHRSVERHRDLPRLPESVDVEDSAHKRAVSTVTGFYQSITDKRIAKAKAAADAFDAEQRKMMIAKGLISDRPDKTSDRLPPPRKQEGSEWDFKHPVLYKTHCALLMPTYKRSQSSRM